MNGFLCRVLSIQVYFFLKENYSTKIQEPLFLTSVQKPFEKNGPFLLSEAVAHPLKNKAQNSKAVLTNSYKCSAQILHQVISKDMDA